MILRLLALIAALAIGSIAHAEARQTRITVNSALADQIIRSAARLGIKPLDLATTISYETAGTFDPKKVGPTTQWGRHIGLIQMGGPQRSEYGYDPNGSLEDQFAAIERYLTKAGVRPGHGLADVYSAINAGHVGRYGASDEGNGGAPGTVLDKVRYQMAGHRQKAAELLGGRLTPNIDVADAGTEQGGTPGTRQRAPGGTPAGTDEDDSVEAMIRSFTEPTNDPRRLAIREVAHPLLADLLPDGQGQAVALGDGPGQQAGLAGLASLLGSSSSPAKEPAEETA